MSDLDKVIKDLRRARRIAFDGEMCQIMDADDALTVAYAIDDALILLSEQEPRVLTLEELKTIGDKDAVYLETIVMNLGEPNVKPAIYQPDNSDDEYVCIVSTWCKSGFYGPHNYLKTWRCWSAKPTDEQRGAVPWEK